MSEITNMEKYENYKEQMERLKKAINNHFLLEAIFIEYAVLEDRSESILRYSGVFKPEKHNTLHRKLSKIGELVRNKKSLLRKYITEEMVATIVEWKDKRNTFIHSLMKQHLSSAELEELATQGQLLVKTLCSKSTSYKRALEQHNNK